LPARNFASVAFGIGAMVSSHVSRQDIMASGKDQPAISAYVNLASPSSRMVHTANSAIG
jgi:hypothetical protein